MVVFLCQPRESATDRSGHLKELLPDGGAAGGSHWDTDLVEECGRVVGAQKVFGGDPSVVNREVV
ncbi:hypothetical protein OG741_01040 [Streptomyces sp. NBC_01410]|uniref:hypothetical protein n=1 Tax=Streptomyces sp. NBC_01410 TaxID=2903856 RepID=UPI003246E1AF